LGRFAERILRERGVEIALNTRLEAATGAEALLADGRRIPTRTLISTVPSSPHPRIEDLPVPKSRGRVQVTRELAVEGHDGVWALGDCWYSPAHRRQGPTRRRDPRPQARASPEISRAHV